MVSSAEDAKIRQDERLQILCQIAYRHSGGYTFCVCPERVAEEPYCFGPYSYKVHHRDSSKVLEQCGRCDSSQDASTQMEANLIKAVAARLKAAPMDQDEITKIFAAPNGQNRKELDVAEKQIMAVMMQKIKKDMTEVVGMVKAHRFNISDVTENDEEKKATVRKLHEDISKILNPLAA